MTSESCPIWSGLTPFRQSHLPFCPCAAISQTAACSDWELEYEMHCCTEGLGHTAPFRFLKSVNTVCGVVCGSVNNSEVCFYLRKCVV